MDAGRRTAACSSLIQTVFNLHLPETSGSPFYLSPSHQRIEQIQNSSFRPDDVADMWNLMWKYCISVRTIR